MFAIDVLARSASTAAAAVGPFHWLADITSPGSLALFVIGFLLIATLIVFGVRFIPNDRVGIVEKLWSFKGSVGEGRVMAFNGQAGYEAQLLRGGIHFGKWFWQYRIHKVPLVTVPPGKIGYVYARDGEPLSPGQTLGRLVECANFQNADSFLNLNARSTPRPRAQDMNYADGTDASTMPSSKWQQDTVTRGQRGRQRAILREGVYA